MDGEVSRRFAQRGEAREAVHEEGRLAVAGAGQLVQGTFVHELGKGTAEDFVALGEDARGGGGGGAEFAAHADGLRALPGKKESDLSGHPGLKKNLRFCQRRQ